MLHGNPTWSFYWRTLVQGLGDNYRCIVPDHIGCGLSGSVQHFAGMKTSKVIVAVNTDKDAPIGEIADVLVVADVKQFAPALTAKLAG